MKNIHSPKLKRMGVVQLFLCLLIPGALSLAFNSGSSDVLASDLSNKSLIPDGTSELSTSELKTKIQSNTSTSTTKRFSIQFRTSQIATLHDSNRLFYIAIDDENFSDDINNPFLVETEDKTLNGYALRATRSKNARNSESDSTISIPETITYGTKYSVNVTALGNGAMPFMDAEDYNYKDKYPIKKLYIPKTITKVHENAFSNIPAGVELEINFENKESDITFVNKSNWLNGEGAGDVKVNYDVSFIGNRSVKYTTPAVYFGEAQSFILGYKGGKVEEETIPELLLSYEYQVEIDQKTYYKQGKLNVKDANNPYDSVSANQPSFDTELVINLDFEEEYIDGSLVFYNIYPMISKSVASGGNVFYPDLSSPYMSKATKGYKVDYDISNVVDYSFKEITTFGEYTNIVTNFERVYLGEDKHTLYQEARPEDFVTYAKQFASGDYIIRYRISNLSTSNYIIEYENKAGEVVETTTQIVSPLPYIVLNTHGITACSFLIKNSDVASDFSADKIKSIRIDSLTINMHIYDVSNSTSLGLSNQINCTFGEVYLLTPVTEKIGTFSIVAFILIFTISLAVAFIGAATGLYFYLKEKYKNDEFRRMNTKIYVRKSAIALFGTLIFALGLQFILFRFLKLNNSFAVYNPLDPYVIGFGIAALIAFGYFIYYMIQFIKTEKKRKEAIRLKLNEDVDDDGTH